MYAVMGITGKVGGAVARTLLTKGEKVRGIVRDPEKAAEWQKQGAELFKADYDDVDALTAAFTGVAVSPGAVRTEMLLDVFGTQEALDEMSAVHPIGRIGRPDEIAGAVAWLFSDRSSYYTGQSLTLDGGLTAQRPYVTQPASDKLLQNVRDEKWRVGHADPSMTDDLNCR